MSVRVTDQIGRRPRAAINFEPAAPSLLWTAGTGPTDVNFDGTSLTWAESTSAPVTIRFE